MANRRSTDPISNSLGPWNYSCDWLTVWYVKSCSSCTLMLPGCATAWPHAHLVHMFNCYVSVSWYQPVGQAYIKFFIDIWFTQMLFSHSFAKVTVESGMGTRRKSSRPRRSPLETETFASPAETRPRRDVKISRRDQDVALETWLRRYSTSFIDCNNRPRCYLSRSLFLAC